jgi:NAD(P)-dependent dehydrogenase (short-subunit alcohol dehydrogenase family)
MAFRGKVALVTGGGSGMGQIYAWRLADTGAQVAILDVNEAGMDKTASGRSNIHPFPCDVTDGEALAAIVAEVTEKHGAIDRVIHCAAIMPASEVLDDNLPRMRKVMEVNYFGTLNMFEHCLKPMVERGLGEFVVFGSVAGYALTPHLGAYCASKAAVNALVEITIQENRDSGVKIHLVCPPMVNTPLIKQAQETSNPRSVQQGIEKGIAADPNTIIDLVEKGIAKGTPIIFPSAMAKGLYGMRRFSPKLLWKVIMKSEYAS